MKVFLHYHGDVDGLSGAQIIKTALEKRGATVHLHSSKTVKPHEIQRLSRELHKYDRIYFVDTGAERGPEINKYWSQELRKKTVIIDHHRLFDRERPEVSEYINPEEDGEDSLYYATASVLAWKYVQEEFNEDPAEHALPAVIGAYADIADFLGNLSGLNLEAERTAVEAGVLNRAPGFTARFKDWDTIEAVIDQNYYPTPVANFRQKLPEIYRYKRYYKMTTKEIERLFSDLREVYDGMKDWAFRETVYIKTRNQHFGEIHDAVSNIDKIMKYGHTAAMEAIELLKKGKSPRTALKRGRAFPGSKASMKGTKHIETKNYHIIIGKRRFISSIELTFIATRILIDKPVIAIGILKGTAYVSARTHPSHFESRDLGAEMYNILQKRLGGYGGGHRIAAGGGIPAEKVRDLISILRSGATLLNIFYTPFLQIISMPDVTLDDIYVIEDDRDLNTSIFGRWLEWVNEVEKNSPSRTAAMFRMQKTLNDFIDRKKGINRADKNEWYQRNVLYTAMEVGEILEELKIKHWTKDRAIDRRKLLEEYADAWHFIMSAAIDAGWAGEAAKKITEKDWPPAGAGSRLTAGKKLLEALTCLNMGNKGCYLSAVRLFEESLAEMGYTFDDLYRAYLIKNFKNFARQESPNFRGGAYL